LTDSIKLHNTITEIGNIASNIAEYLLNKQLPDGTFPARDFYGKACSAALWGINGNHIKYVDATLDSISKERINPKSYHFEFNRFALSKLEKIRPNNKIPVIKGFRGTRVANWTLLRITCRYQTGGIWNRCMAAIELRAVKLLFGRKKGLIEDDFNAYTMQYHAFSVALLGELIQGPLSSSNWVKRWFWKTLDGFCQLILDGGQCNYIGRGSLQSFGYGAAVLALSHGYSMSGNRLYLDLLNRILNYIKEYQGIDGELPLVLSKNKEGKPECFDLLSESYAGWWSYNNYYDYLPFTGFVFILAKKVLESSDVVEHLSQLASTSTGDIRVVRKNDYNATLALPNKLWAASMPMPYISYKKEFPFPIYGGEQMQDSLYRIEGLPLPIVQTNNKPIYCANASYRWVKEYTFEGTLKGLQHLRQVEFENNIIRIMDDVVWDSSLVVTSVQLPRLMLAENEEIECTDRTVTMKNIIIEFNGKISKEPERYFSPNGYLNSYTLDRLVGKEKSVSSVLTIKLV